MDWNYPDKIQSHNIQLEGKATTVRVTGYDAPGWDKDRKLVTEYIEVPDDGTVVSEHSFYK